MIKNILTHIGGIENYGLISLLLFFTFFTGMLIWAFTRKKSYLNDMAAAPLDPQPTDSRNSENSHE